MTQIQNFGFVAPVQESDVQHTPQPCGGTGQSGGKPEGSQYALRHPYHSGAHGQGFGGNLSFGNYHQQFSDGVVPPVQIPSSERA